ncbi:hypothetical protein F4808DRAFT_58208 [Astrocystis sublimbata]|nr:hypothetical protein F4808DRAFT_58208 [Astrocystis sublimbata]
MELTAHNGISIVQIIFFVPFLLIAILLTIRHGIKRDAAWLFLVFFSLSRLIGASLQLATIAYPQKTSLQIGVFTLQSVGLSDLILMLLALLTRALTSMEKGRSAVIQPRILWWIQFLVFVGVILNAIGGPSSSSSFAKTGVYKISNLSIAGTSLTIAGFALLVVATAIMALKVSYAEPGEKRLVLAVALSLPFLLVRVLYSAIGTFRPNSDFSLARGSIFIYLGTAVIEEIIIMLIVEIMGLTLQVLPKTDLPPSEPGPLKRLVTSFKNRSRHPSAAAYEPRRLDQAEERRAARVDRRQGGYEMQGTHSPNQSMSSV